MRGNLGVDAGIVFENLCVAVGNYVLFDVGVFFEDYFSGDLI